MAYRTLPVEPLQVDPVQRLGCSCGGPGTLKAHPWFAEQHVDWDALAAHTQRPPSGIRERIYNFEGLDLTLVPMEPYDGDMSWAEHF